MKLDKIILILLISITLASAVNKKIDIINMIVNNSTNMKPTITSPTSAVLGKHNACLEMLDESPYVVASCTILGSFAEVIYYMIVITIYITQYL